MQAKKLQAALSTQPVFVESVFSTYLYTGNGSTQTITNGIDLSGKGGLVWLKDRTSGAHSHWLTDTARGVNFVLRTNATDAQASVSGTYLTSFNSNGFGIGGAAQINTLNNNLVSWTFRKQAKFFDVVTYTGTGSPRSVSHNLGSAPGMVIVKRYDSTGQWAVWHRSGNQTNGKYGAYLDATDAYTDQATNLWGSTTTPPVMTATEFNVGTDGAVNSNGFSYVAYLFAHDTDADGIIQCGSFTTDSSGNATVNLGWEPQFVLYKSSSAVSTAWYMMDSMRGWPVSGNTSTLIPNSSNAEAATTSRGIPMADGFTCATGSASASYIYIAIRRGPMKTPTDATKVYNPITRSGNSTATTVTGVGFAPDLVFEAPRTNSGGNNWIWFDRLRGGAEFLSSDITGAAGTNSVVIQSDSLSTTMDGFRIQTANPINATGNTYVYYPLRRAPGFFDVVCYTGTGANQTLSHNLGVVPELMIVKNRSDATGRAWAVYAGDATDYLVLNTTAATGDDIAYWNDTSPTSSVFTVGTSNSTNESSDTFVAYLFATCPGVSKVFSYTGNGSSQTINCGFTGGARFVLIKRTDSTGDWYVWDSARGIVAGNDPHLSLNTTAAEVTTDDSVDTDSTGFIVNQLAATNINVNAATYIGIAIS